jgi:integrase
VRRLARTAQIGAWEQLSPHSLRHSAITFALDAGAALRDVQDYAGHKEAYNRGHTAHPNPEERWNEAKTIAPRSGETATRITDGVSFGISALRLGAAPGRM